MIQAAASRTPAFVGAAPNAPPPSANNSRNATTAGRLSAVHDLVRLSLADSRAHGEGHRRRDVPAFLRTLQYTVRGRRQSSAATPASTSAVLARSAIRIVIPPPFCSHVHLCQGEQRIKMSRDARAHVSACARNERRVLVPFNEADSDRKLSHALATLARSSR